MSKNDNSDDSDISFESHIELGDLGNSQLLSTQKLVTTSQNNEIAASVNDRHRILNQVFNGWRNAIKQIKIDKFNKMTFQRYFSKKKIYYFFNRWKDHYLLFQNLHNLGQNILVTKHFQYWNNVVNQKFEERKRFMRFLLKRRSIYERIFFKEWKRSMGLARRYYVVGKQSDSKLCHQAISAFRIQIRKKHKQENLELLVKGIHEKYTKIACIFKWKQRIRLIHLMRLYTKSHNYQIKRIFFEKWFLQKKKKDRISRKYKTVQKISRKYLRRLFFSRWNAKYISKVDIEEKTISLAKLIQKRSFEIYFMKWLSRFNTNNYLSTSEKALKNLLRDIIIRRYFCKWHSKYDIIHRKYLNIEVCEEEMRIRKLSRLFMEMRSQYAIRNFEKVMSRKAHRRLDIFLKRIFWEKWKISLKLHIENRSLIECANNFRILSLKLKAFNRIKIYYRNKQMRQQQMLVAQAHYVYHLEISAMIAWKLLHRQTKRRFLMVSSVLKVWAHNLQKKKFKKWLEYTNQKKKQKRDILEAIEIHKRRNVSMAITSFVLATKSLPMNFIGSESELDYSEDLLKSSLSFNNSLNFDINNKEIDDENVVYNDNNVKTPNKENIHLPSLQENNDFTQENIYYGHPKLPAPKRPDFLGKRADVYPMQHMISMVNAPIDYNKTQNQLKMQMEEVIAKIQSCRENEEEDNENEIKQLNMQLKSLMNQANQLLSQLP